MPMWYKSGRSNNLGIQNCVKIARNQLGGLTFADSKLGEASPQLNFTPHEVGAFFASVVAGWDPKTGQLINSDGQVIGVFPVPDESSKDTPVLIPA